MKLSEGMANHSLAYFTQLHYYTSLLELLLGSCQAYCLTGGMFRYAHQKKGETFHFAATSIRPSDLLSRI